MPYNLAQAGAAVGKSKATILRAIRRGVISAERDAVTGGWAIEPAEFTARFSRLPMKHRTTGLKRRKTPCASCAPEPRQAKPPLPTLRAPA